MLNGLDVKLHVSKWVNQETDLSLLWSFLMKCDRPDVNSWVSVDVEININAQIQMSVYPG